MVSVMGRVKEITGPGGIKVEYKFKGEDLVEVKNMWKNKYSYEYDGAPDHLRLGLDFVRYVSAKFLSELEEQTGRA